jgi:hypothetical protein
MNMNMFVFHGLIVLSGHAVCASSIDGGRNPCQGRRLAIFTRERSAELRIVLMASQRRPRRRRRTFGFTCPRDGSRIAASVITHTVVMTRQNTFVSSYTPQFNPSRAVAHTYGSAIHANGRGARSGVWKTRLRRRLEPRRSAAR